MSSAVTTVVFILIYLFKTVFSSCSGIWKLYKMFSKLYNKLCFQELLCKSAI